MTKNQPTDPKNKFWLYLFFIDALLNLFAELTHNQTLIYISKPLLMIFLGLHFWTNRTTNRFTNLILAGLFFAFLGDTLLMFRVGAEGQTNFFLFGLASFLLTQLCYSIAFWGYGKKTSGTIFRKPLLAIPFIAFLVGNMALLWEGLPTAFRLPVLAYSTVITLMAVSCCNLFNSLPSTIFKWLMIGVVLFVISDTMIGISSFKMQIPYSGLLIMGTYIAAQYLIVRGSLLLEGKGDEVIVSSLTKIS